MWQLGLGDVDVDAIENAQIYAPKYWQNDSAMDQMATPEASKVCNHLFMWMLFKTNKALYLR